MLSRRCGALGGGGHSWALGGAVGREGAGAAGGAAGDVLRCCRPGGGLSVSDHVSSMSGDAQQQVRTTLSNGIKSRGSSSTYS